MGDPTVCSQQEPVPSPPSPLPVSAALVSGWGNKPSKRGLPGKENGEEESGARNGVGTPKGSFGSSGRLHDHESNATAPSPSGLEDVPGVKSEDATTAVAERSRADLEVVDNEDIEDVTGRTKNNLGARSSTPPSHAVSAFESRQCRRSETSESKRGGRINTSCVGLQALPTPVEGSPYYQQGGFRSKKKTDIWGVGGC